MSKLTGNGDAMSNKCKKVSKGMCYTPEYNFETALVRLLLASRAVAQSVGHLTRKSEVLGSIPDLATYFHFSFRFFKKAVVSYRRKYVHELLVNRLGGLSLSRKSAVRLTDRPNMTLDVYYGRKTTIQQLLLAK